MKIIIRFQKNNISRLKFSIALYGQYFLKIFQKNLKIDRILDTKIVFSPISQIVTVPLNRLCCEIVIFHNHNFTILFCNSGPIRICF